MGSFTTNDIRALVYDVLAQEAPPIIQLGEPVLRNRAEVFDGQLDDSELAQLLTTMRTAMHNAPGVGLAAPQLGIPLRIAVIEDVLEQPEAVARVRERPPLPYFAIINPTYTPVGPERASFFEGCLSFSGWQAVVERHRTVQLEYQTPDGQLASRQCTGWPARIVQHETDHLDGVVYVDKAHTRSLVSSASYAERWAQPDIGLAQRSLNF